MNSQAKPAADRWPPQIKYIVGNEACERFSYYGMTGILAGYITGKLVAGGLQQSDDTAAVIIHVFKSVNYFMPLLGAWLSDRITGRYHTILWGSLFYCAGHGMLACSDFPGTVDGKLMLLVIGLGLIAFGSGAIKPCVSAFMGDQFKSEQSQIVQKAYGAFYWSINFGSFFSFLVVPWVKSHHGYSMAFGVPGILMGIATFVFWLGTKYYVRVAPSRETKQAGFLPVFRAAYRQYPGSKLEPLFNLFTTIGLPLFAMIVLTIVAFMKNETPEQHARIVRIGVPALISTALWYVLVVLFSVLRRTQLKDGFWQSARNQYSDGEINAAKSLSPILFVLALIPVFWSLFDQSNSTWVLQGERMTAVLIPSGYVLGLLMAIAVLLLVLAVVGRDAVVRPVFLILIALAAVAGIVVLVMLLLKLFGASRADAAHYLPQSVIGVVLAIGMLIVGMRSSPRFVRGALGVLGLGSLIALFLERHLISEFKIAADEMQSANPALVMILVPLLTLVVYPRIGRWASPLRRMSVGMFLAALSYIIVALIQQRIESGAQISVLWQTLPYIVLTTAEVLISTTGLEFAFREAAPEMKSILMGLWLATVSFGNILVAGITQILAKPGAATHADSVSPGRFLQYAGLTFIVAILFAVVAAFYNYRDPATAEGK